MEWVKDFYNTSTRKLFSVIFDDAKVIKVNCWKDWDGWNIEIAGWNVSNYRFQWHERFHQKNILAKVDYIIQNVDAAKLAILNRIFEGSM